MTDILKIGKVAQGKVELKKYREGRRLTMREQIKAKCYECTGGYIDGVEDCRVTDCPTYPSHPYNPDRQKVR